MRFAADTPVGFVGGRGACAATLPDTDIPALLHEGALGALGGQLDFFRNVLTLGRLGVGVPLKANGMGHYVLSVASLGNIGGRNLYPLFCGIRM